MIDVEKMARDAGMWVLSDPEPGFVPKAVAFTGEGMERFAQAVARRCAEICTQYAAKTYWGEQDGAEDCAAAIRAEFGIEGE